MDRPPFFAFYPSDFSGDINVEAMSTLQVGAYVLLLCKAWQADPPASLPNDDAQLARFARVEAGVWAEIKAGVMSAFRFGSDGRWHSKRLRLEYDKALQLIRTKKAAGKKGAESRWNGRKAPNGGAAHSTAIGGANGCAMAQPLAGHCDGNAIQSQNQIQKTEKEEERVQQHARQRAINSPPGPDDYRRPPDQSADEAGGYPPMAEVREAWGQAGMKPETQDVPGRRSKFQARWDADPAFRRDWRELIQRVARNPRHRADGDRPMTLSWFLGSGTVDDIRAGNYDPPKAAGSDKPPTPTVPPGRHIHIPFVAKES